jgi:hypothetical protein
MVRGLMEVKVWDWKGLGKLDRLKWVIAVGLVTE